VKSIFVGNLDFGASEESIRSLFESHGIVERVNVIVDRETGRSRGFAFVEMTDADQAEEAIVALNGTTLGDRAIHISEARPKLDLRGAGRA
jgi:RNA recognition motif-containing protein